MFNWKKYKKPPKKTERNVEIEYSFIWYRKMKTSNGTTYFTQPFRTKIKAKSYGEAIKKLTQFVLGKMELVIVNEDKFEETEFSKLHNRFEDIHKRINSLIDNLK